MSTDEAVSMVHDWVSAGRISAEEGAILLELRAELAWRRRPWWSRALTVLLRAVFGP